MRIAIAGGTGRAGAHAVRVAQDRGHEVTVLARAAGVDLVEAGPVGYAEDLGGPREESLVSMVRRHARVSSPMR